MNVSHIAATARLADNEPTGGSFARRRCRFFGRVGTNSPAAIVRMPSTAMTPVAMLVRGHTRIRCCTLWRRRPLVIRLGHRQILRLCNCRQCTDNQSAAYKSDIHARLRCVAPDPKAGVIRPLIDSLASRSLPPRARGHRPLQLSRPPKSNVTPIPLMLRKSSVAITSVVKMIQTPYPVQGQHQAQ